MSGSYYDFLALESRAYDIAHWIAMEARVAESLDRSVAPIEIEGARRIVALASARPTPAAGEGPVIHIPDDAEYRDDGSVHWRVRLPVGAASGEGEAQKVEAVLRRWNRLAGDVEGSDGPLTDTEIEAIAQEVESALLRTSSGVGEIAAVLDAVEAEADKWDDGIVPSFASRETVREIRRRLAVLLTEARGEEEALAAEILAELRRARGRFPGDNVTTLALVEEVGELAKATFEEGRDRVRQEAIQVAAMAMRVVLDGDQTLDAWRAAKGLDPLIAARRGEGGGE